MGGSSMLAPGSSSAPSVPDQNMPTGNPIATFGQSTPPAPAPNVNSMAGPVTSLGTLGQQANTTGTSAPTPPTAGPATQQQSIANLLMGSNPEWQRMMQANPSVASSTPAAAASMNPILAMLMEGRQL